MGFFKKIGLDSFFSKKKHAEAEVVSELEKTQKSEPLSQKEIQDSVNKQILPVVEAIKENENKTSYPISTNKLKGIIVKFYFKETNYILEEFDLRFDQEVNSKGYPDGLPRGGTMTLVLQTPPDDNINEWMQKENLLCDGEIRFLSHKTKIDEGALLTISFAEAFCIRYKKTINPSTGLLTTLVISPKYVKIGNEEFENRWKKAGTTSHYIRSK